MHDKSVQKCVRVDAKTDARIKAQAVAEGLDEADIVRRWLRLGRAVDPQKVPEPPTPERA